MSGFVRWALAIGSLLAPLIPVPAQAQNITLGFPVARENPYTAPIITVLDHSTIKFYDDNQSHVLAYTGEQADRGPVPRDCGPSGQPCGYYNWDFIPRDNSDKRQFIVNHAAIFGGTSVIGGYKGDNGDCTKLLPPLDADCLEQRKILNYRGHPGYDYSYDQTTQIIAPAPGKLYRPASDPVNNFGRTTDPWCTRHTFFIDHGKGWTTWYLHADRLIVGSLSPDPCPADTHIPGHVLIKEVVKNEPIAVVGNVGAKGVHLHFEVRLCDIDPLSGLIVVEKCLVVDPYGWEWMDSDPLSNGGFCNTNPPIRCATTQLEPLWDSRRPLVSDVSVVGSPGAFTATITGQDFEPGALVTLWSRYRKHRTDVITPCPTCITRTQITAVPLNISNPGEYVLKVDNPNGPRSRGVAIAFSVPLVLAGQPAPGGGTFAGSGGFWSATDTNRVTFGAGVDSRGGTTPDSFSDFEYSSKGISKITVPGFSNVSSAATHIRLDNQGDISFGDVNGLYGGAPAAIYLLKSGAAAPIKIAEIGGPCPSPCPLPGSPTFYQLVGPLAISDAGDVTFSTGFLNPVTRIAECCFLYLYSGGSGSLVKVAADGPNGDSTPVGGKFESGTLLNPINQITTEGSVIFRANVTGGTSQSGIFRFTQVTPPLSKVVAQGDPAPAEVGGTLGSPLMGRTGSISGRRLVFHAPVLGGLGNQVIVIKNDVTLNSLSDVTLVAYQGQLTGSVAGGGFSSPYSPSQLPFAGFGQNTAPPTIRCDGDVVFHSLLTGATAQDGTSTDQGIFRWVRKRKIFEKILVDGDRDSSGHKFQGTGASVVNCAGGVFYFVATLQ